MSFQSCARPFLAAALLALVAGLAPAQDKKDEKAEKEVEKIAEALGVKMHFFESKYFTFCSCKPAATMAKLSKTADEAFENFNVDTKVQGWKHLWQDQKTMIVVLPSKGAFKQYIKWYADTYPVWNKEQFVKNHEKSDFCHEIQQRRMIACHLKPHDLDYLIQVVAHQTGFLCANRLHFKANFVPPWLEEFTGAWIEAKTTDQMVCSTTRDSYGATPFKIDDGPKKVFKKFLELSKDSFAKGNAKTVAGIMRPRLHELKLVDLYTGYVLIDWMRSQPGKYSAWVRAVRRNWPSAIESTFSKAQQEAQEKAFKEVYNVTLPELDKALKEHAKKL
ncbi:MAG: hypothetical protein R3F20_01660 [Planctomycetota bacterium]